MYFIYQRILSATKNGWMPSEWWNPSQKWSSWNNFNSSSRNPLHSLYDLPVCLHVWSGRNFTRMCSSWFSFRSYYFGVLLFKNMAHIRRVHPSIFWSLCKLFLWKSDVKFCLFSSFVLLESWFTWFFDIMNIPSKMKVIMVGIVNPHFIVLELATSMNAVSFFCWWICFREKRVSRFLFDNPVVTRIKF